ncbi:enhancer of mRNA-decapping protein 3-like isoform X2 [Uloborus diversus]|nr:enhancer of mRNA-decapping protein 3-like isoform X2 [Uloborus diversus]
MSFEWIGSIISVDCGDVLGIFEGEISNVDGNNQTISLINVSRNNIKCQVPEVTLSSLDIRSLTLLQSTANNNTLVHANDSEKVSAFESPSISRNNCSRNSPSDDSQKKKNDGKKKNSKKNDVKKWLKEKDEACFSAPVDSEMLDTDFDFEKNLALFDKRAVFDEINALSKADHVKLVDCNKRTQPKYRHDENILSSDVPVLRQISVPCENSKEYVTDAGLVVPSVSIEFKKRLYEKAEKAGLTSQVRTEMIGRAASEMALQLLGGGHRLNPQNTHQKPTVVLLCGSHAQGTQGVNCGRHLANHCVNVVILHPELNCETQAIISKELKLFSMSGGKLVNNVSGLPSSVDIIIEALDAHDGQNSCEKSWLHNAQQWAKQHSKAPVMCLDPPPNCNGMDKKFILSPALPFKFENDTCSIHICDIGLPKDIFSSLQCSYSSPFGSKFVIPLYSRNT